MSGQSEFSLINLLVGISIAGITITIATQSMNNLAKKKATIMFLEQKIKARKMISENVDCEVPPDCNSQTTLNIRDKLGRVIIKADGSAKIGNFSARAICTDKKAVEIQLASLGTNGNFNKDPLTGKVLDWNNQDLKIFKAGEFCPTISNIKGKSFSVEGELCHYKKGSCKGYPPKEYATMCCPNGSDKEKPTCPDNTTEINARWDRIGDWGINGRWVLVCQ